MPPYQKKTWQPSRSSEIKKFQETKSRQIARFADKKELSIITTSSINSAVDWCVAHPLWRTEMTDVKRWDWIDKTAVAFIEYHATKRDELGSLYAGLKSKADQAEAEAEKKRSGQMQAQLADFGHPEDVDHFVGDDVKDE